MSSSRVSCDDPSSTKTSLRQEFTAPSGAVISVQKRLLLDNGVEIKTHRESECHASNSDEASDIKHVEASDIKPFVGISLINAIHENDSDAKNMKLFETFFAENGLQDADEDCDSIQDIKSLTKAAHIINEPESTVTRHNALVTMSKDESVSKTSTNSATTVCQVFTNRAAAALSANDTTTVSVPLHKIKETSNTYARFDGSLVEVVGIKQEVLEPDNESLGTDVDSQAQGVDSEGDDGMEPLVEVKCGSDDFDNNVLLKSTDKESSVGSDKKPKEVAQNSTVASSAKIAQVDMSSNIRTENSDASKRSLEASGSGDFGKKRASKRIRKQNSVTSKKLPLKPLNTARSKHKAPTRKKNINKTTEACNSEENVTCSKCKEVVINKSTRSYTIGSNVVYLCSKCSSKPISREQILSYCKPPEVKKSAGSWRRAEAVARIIWKPRDKCPECGSMVRDLEYHINILHTTLPCEKCGKTFQKKALLTKHIKLVHSDEYTFPCVDCKKVFTSQYKLSRHRRRSMLCAHASSHPRISASPKYKCTLCEKAFQHNYNLRMHMNVAHTSRDERIEYKCNLCEKVFYTSYGCFAHMRRHKDKYFCDKCGKCFTTVSNLQQHMKSLSHLSIVTPEGKTEEVRDFLCEACGVRFGSKHHLRQHYKSMTHQNMVSGDNSGMKNVTRKRKSANPQNSHKKSSKKKSKVTYSSDSEEAYSTEVDYTSGGDTETGSLCEDTDIDTDNLCDDTDE